MTDDPTAPPYEYMEIPLWGESPVNHPAFPSAASVLNDMSLRGWEYIERIDGQHHPVAEHCIPVKLIFRRRKVGM